MPLQFNNIPEALLSGGIDARSAENQIGEGFLRDALNVETVQKHVRKRKGYVGYGGNFPVRVISTEWNHSEQEICFTLDAAVDGSSLVDLLEVRSSPIVVYGRISSGNNGSYSTSDTVHYYTGFTQKIRKLFVNNVTEQTLSIPAAEHGLGTDNVFLGVSESLDPTLLSNQLIEYNALSINTAANASPYNIDIKYVNSTGLDKSVFVYYADKDNVSGSVYKSSNLVVTAGNTGTLTVTAVQHQLSNFNIVARLYQHDSVNNQYILVRPDSLHLDPATGEVNITVTNGTASTVTYFAILSAAPSVNTLQGSLSGSTYTISITNPDKAFIFPGIYENDGSLLKEVIPDAVTYDATLDRIDITFEVYPGANSFTAYWEYATIRSTQLCVEDTDLNTTGSDGRPQLTIWGLDHSEIYADAVNQAGWGNHLDSFRTSGENRIVAGLGGNLFSVREYSENGASHYYGLSLSDLSKRLAASTHLAPVFWDTADTPLRSRGYISGTGLSENWAKVTSVAYDSSVAGGTTRYTLTIPGLAINGTLSTIISTVSGLEDWATFTDMSYKRHNGTFRIRQIDNPNATTLRIWVENSEVTNTNYDDSGVGGYCGVFTEKLTLSGASPFLPDDSILSDAIPGTLNPTVLLSSGTSIIVDGIVDQLTLGAGVQLIGERTGVVIPLRNIADQGDVTNFVRGDMVSYTDINRLVRVLYVNPVADAAASIQGDSSSGLATVTVSDTTHLSAGQAVLLRNAGDYNGEHVIQSILSGTEFTIRSNSDDLETSAVVVGHTIHVGEEVTWKDSTADNRIWKVERRLIPIEAPDDNYSLTPNTYIKHLTANTAGNQPWLRSTMVSDNLYFTNGDDAILKYNGEHLHRAGIPNWQPGCLIQFDTGASAKIDTGLRRLTITAVDPTDRDLGRVRVTSEVELSVFPIGTSVFLAGDPNPYTITALDSSGSTYSIFLDRVLSGLGATLLLERAVYRYYYRINAVDANLNVIASAFAQSEDYAIQVFEDCGIYHKLIGLPAFDNYDYDTLYLQVYRTKNIASSTGTAPTFYKVYQQRIPYNANSGYVDFLDSLSDDNLIDLDPLSALVGAELGIGWQEPLRAKHITAAANTLVLGNIKDYPQFDIQLFGLSTVNPATLNGMTFKFDRDNSVASGVVTDMINTVIYELTNSAGITITGIVGTVGTSFEVTTASSHGLSVGDWTYIAFGTDNLFDTTNRNTEAVGWWQVNSIVSATKFTVLYAGVTSATLYGTKLYTAVNKKNVPVLVDTDYSMGMFSGNSNNHIFQAARRLALAVNATMANVNRAVSNQSAFTPWLMARGGNDTGVSGKLSVRQPFVSPKTVRLTLGAISGYSVFVNDVEYNSASTIDAESILYPSRLLIGYENYPEIFDNPTEILDTSSASAIDVNPSDGQEITGIIPFFGDAAFGSAQQSSVIVVFKENSIYLVDASQKRLGNPAVQRIETEGVGCTAPDSISVTKNGIMFANGSGIYVLRRNLSVEYVGKYMERQWTERVDLSKLSLVKGHHYNTGRQYKLSVPLLGDSENSEVFVYDPSNEAERGIGSWTRYDNHHATGWCNLGRNAYFTSTDGRLYQLRNNNDIYDYQDDNVGINMVLQLRPNDFGISGIRKVVDSIVINYRTAIPSQNTSVKFAMDTEEEYIESTGVRVTRTNLTGIGDSTVRGVLTVKHNTSRKRGLYISVEISNSARLESVEIAGVEYSVALLGNRQDAIAAAETK